MDKKKKLKRQVSNDGGMTWQDMIPYEYIAGELIERDSPDCNNIEWRTVSGYICEENTTEMTQWVADTGYVCVGFNKMNKEKEQVSYNSGISWADTGNTRAGSTLIEQNSTDCGYVPTPSIRWVADTGYVCVGYDKYNKEKEQQSTDGGTTWTDTGNTRAGSTLIEANSTDCGYSPHDYSQDYFTTEALEGGTIRGYYGGNLSYSKNNGAWTTYTEGTDISVATGDTIRWKGTVQRGNSDERPFTSTGDYKVYGNIMSLHSGDNFVGVTVIPSYTTFAYMFYNQTTLKDASNLILPATNISAAPYFYYGMFYGCTSLTTTPALPATTLSDSCYGVMFMGCTSLTTAPELPATKLARDCYFDMFSDCTSLTTAPALPATTLANYCYQQMFMRCTSLTTAPVLPATTLVSSCYESMFMGCSSLTTAPVLPATTLVAQCYEQMFLGCGRLSGVTCLARYLSASDCTKFWLRYVSSTGTFTKAAGVTWSRGEDGIPSGWTVQDE